MRAPSIDIAVLERLPEKNRARLQQWAGLLAAAPTAAKPRRTIPGLRLRVTLATIAVRVRQAREAHSGPKTSTPTSSGRAGSRPSASPARPRRTILDCLLPPGCRPGSADADCAEDVDTVDLWAAWPAGDLVAPGCGA